MAQEEQKRKKKRLPYWGLRSVRKSVSENGHESYSMTYPIEYIRRKKLNERHDIPIFVGEEIIVIIPSHHIKPRTKKHSAVTKVLKSVDKALVKALRG